MTIPSGFTAANTLQAADFAESASVNGASKVTVVGGTLYVRLRPPQKLDHVESNLGRRSVETIAAYVEEYNKGWRTSSRSSEFPSGTHAFDDGYMDYAAGRPKWHLAHCSNHDECGEG